MNATHAHLRLERITKSLEREVGKKPPVVLKDLTVSFPIGRLTGLVGHNGAGKTTAIRIILGLLAPDRGSIFFRGHPMQQRDKTRIGYMPETQKLPHGLTLEEILRAHLELFRGRTLNRRQVRDKVVETLEHVSLWKERDKRAEKLSKGMGRRLAWALATIHEPELVILDEPFAGLDPVGRRDMLDWIRSLREQETTVILCTHQLWLVREVCDGVHVLRNGKVAFSTIEACETQPDLDIGRDFHIDNDEVLALFAGGQQ